MLYRMDLFKLIIDICSLQIESSSKADFSSAYWKRQSEDFNVGLDKIVMPETLTSESRRFVNYEYSNYKVMALCT